MSEGDSINLQARRQGSEPFTVRFGNLLGREDGAGTGGFVEIFRGIGEAGGFVVVAFQHRTTQPPDRPEAGADTGRVANNITQANDAGIFMLFKIFKDSGQRLKIRVDVTDYRDGLLIGHSTTMSESGKLDELKYSVFTQASSGTSRRRSISKARASGGLSVRLFPAHLRESGFEAEDWRGSHEAFLTCSASCSGSRRKNKSRLAQE